MIRRELFAFGYRLSARRNAYYFLADSQQPIASSHDSTAVAARLLLANARLATLPALKSLGGACHWLCLCHGNKH